MPALATSLRAVAAALLASGNAATLTTSVPTDLPSVLGRFQTMDAEITNLQMQVDAMRDGILQVESLVTSLGSSIARSMSTVEAASRVAKHNTAAAEALQAQAQEAAERVRMANSKVAQLQGLVNTLQENAQALGGASVEISTKIAQLERKAKALPGDEGDVTARVAKAEETLQAYESQLASGALDGPVAARLRASFKQATASVVRLADDAKKEVLAERGGEANATAVGVSTA
mmetsp:Transcript_28004/g.65380  ORF Transcript_28004/g.65380 Transcript_28004/m.65380 type:complete len:233 (-) Transcript_28004:54-752(-)